jgi:hypothetical protein
MTEIRCTDPHTGGQKGQKPERFELLPWDALEEVARVYDYGARKYNDDNWLLGYPWRWSLGALARHTARMMVGEDRDPESSLLHAAHAAFHCLTLITFALRRLGTDDRRKATLTFDRAATRLRPSWDEDVTLQSMKAAPMVEPDPFPAAY